MNNRSRSFCQRGFTLLELLIALALVGLMVSLLFGALRFSGKAWNSTEDHGERDAGMRLVWQYLSDRLQQAEPVSGTIAASRESHFFFTGLEQELEFVAPMPAHLGSGGLYIIRLYKNRVENKIQLVLARWLYHPEVLAGEAELPEWQPLESSMFDQQNNEQHDSRAYYSESVLVDDLKRLEFDYFGPEDPIVRQGGWFDHWQDKKYLPWLLKVQISDAAGDWPEMIFELPAS